MWFMQDRTSEFPGWARAHLAVEAYQFSYQPTFHRWLDIVLWHNSSGELNSAMTLKSMIFGYPTDQLENAMTTEGPLEPAAWQMLHEILELHEFWRDEEWTTQQGLDGANWLFLGYQHESLKVRRSWSPGEGTPAHSLGWFFFNLVPANFCPVMTSKHASEWMRGLPAPMPRDFPIVVVY